MAFTFNLTTDIGKVRQHIGDTVVENAFLQDDEIQVALDQSTSLLWASWRACKFILAKVARENDRSASGINSSRSQKFTQYKDLCAELKAQAQDEEGDGIEVGGVSISEKTSIESNEDFPPHTFQVGMDDNGRALTRRGQRREICH